MVRFGVAHGAVLVTMSVISILGMAEVAALVAVGVVTVAWAIRLPLRFAMALGVVAWAYYTGFVVNEYGQLTFAPADLARLVLLVACAAAAHWSR